MYFVYSIIFVPVLLLGFTIASSLATRVSENQWWMLTVGVFCAVLMPVVLASWLRSLRRGQAAHQVPERSLDREQEEEPPQELPRSPTTLGTMVALNLVIIGVACLAAPALTRAAVDRHGSWWARGLAAVVGKKPEHALVLRTDATLRYLAHLLPAEAPAARLSPAKLDGAVARAPDAAPPPTPTSFDDGGPAVPGEVRVTFKKKGSAIIVPVTLQGLDGEAKVKMLFDTGATLTTVDTATLRRLGLAVGPGDPVVESHTAAGAVRRHLTVIDGADLGGATVENGLAVAVCDPCARGDVVGLLGLNFSRHFLVTVDHEGGALLLKPRAPSVGKVHDIRHFVELEHAKGMWRGPLLKVTLVVKNRSARGLRRVKVAAIVTSGKKSGQITSTVDKVPARGQVSVSMSGFPKVKGSKFLVKLLNAEW